MRKNRILFNKLNNMNVNDVIIEFLSSNEFKLTNNSDQKYSLRFVDPQTGFVGYEYLHFNKFSWVESRLKTWQNRPKLVDVILQSNSDKIHLRVNTEEKTFQNITLYHSVVDEKFIPHEITIIIAAYKASEHVVGLVDNFLNQIKNISDLNFEILIGIDNCYETLETVSNNNFNDNVKFYFSKENVGPYFIFNSLSQIAQYDNLLFFGVDDIPKSNLLSVILPELKKSDLVRFHVTKKINGQPNPNENNKVVGPGVFAIKKQTFFKYNGFYPWRTSADTEFNMRTISKKINEKVLDESLMYYVINENSNQLTMNSFSGFGSKLRDVYQKIMKTRQIKKSFPDPKKLKVVPLIRVF